MYSCVLYLPWEVAYARREACVECLGRRMDDSGGSEGSTLVEGAASVVYRGGGSTVVWVLTDIDAVYTYVNEGAMPWLMQLRL